MNTQTQPPTKTKSAPNGGKEAKEAKPKAEKVAKDPNAPAKPRAPRKDYGFSLKATIKLTDGTPVFKGDRLDWYNAVKEANGLTVEQFYEKVKDKEGGPARGWIRFFVSPAGKEAIVLVPPPAEAVAATATDASKPA